MAKATSTKQLASMIERLEEQRQAHLDAVADIDEIFGRFGIKPGAKKRGGRRRAAKKTRKARKTRKGKKARKAKKTRKTKKKARRVRRKVSGPQAVLEFVKRGGRKGATGAEIVSHWESQGRGGGAYRAIGLLVKSKDLKKHALKGERGSRYTAA